MQVKLLRGIVSGAGAAFALAMVAPMAAHAQAQTSGTRFGIEADYADKSINFGVGAFVKFHLADMSDHPITGRVSFDYFFPSTGCGAIDCGGYSAKYFEVNADGLYDIANSSSNIKPYVGAGLTYAHSSFSYNAGFCGEFAADCSSSGSDFGLNILGGINFGNSKMMPFVEAKFELRSGGLFVLKGGIHFK